MKTLLNPFAAAILLAALPIAAQWPDYKAAGIPRTPDGKVNLTAPAPKAADGHPDLSGVWDLRGTGGRGGPGGPGRGPGGREGRSSQGRAPSASSWNSSQRHV